jgi:hypothetical protein
MAMHPGMKMLMMDRVRQQPEHNRSEYGGGNRRMIGYDRGMDGNATTSNYGGSYGYEPEHPHMGGYPMEARRRRDSRGRYMMGGMDYDEDESQSYSPHMRGGGSRYGFGDVYAEIHAPGAMNRPEYGGMDSSMAAPVDEHTARKWVQKMDGGQKFTPEQADQMRNAHCPDCDRWEFYVAMNAMYSDYCETAKKMGTDKADFYALMAKDFLKDKDAKPNKLRRYMESVAN